MSKPWKENRMKPKDILETNRPPVILIFAASGTGKTALVTQASNGYVFDFDNGMLTAAKLKDKFFDARQSVEFDVFNESNPRNPEMYHKARVKLVEIGQQIRLKKWPHNAIIIDSITGLAEVIKLKVMKDQAGDALAEPSRQHWGAMVNYMRAFLIEVRSLGVLTLITAHLQTIEDDKGAVLGIFPSSITKNHGVKDLPWCVDEMWYAQVTPGGGGKFEYSVSGAPVNKVTTCSRSSLGRVVHNDIGLVGLLEKVGYKYKA